MFWKPAIFAVDKSVPFAAGVSVGLGSLLANAGNGAPDSPEGWGMLGVAVVSATALALGVLKLGEAIISKWSGNKGDSDPVEILREIRDQLSNRLERIESSLQDPFTSTRFAALANQRHTELVATLTELSRDQHKLQDAARAIEKAAKQASCPVRVDDDIRRALDEIKAQKRGGLVP